VSAVAISAGRHAQGPQDRPQSHRRRRRLDQQFYENYACGAARNYTGYCNPELKRRFDQQSMESDEGKRKKLVWEIERKLAEGGARPIIFYNRFAYCWQLQVKGWMMMVNGIINNWRMEDAGSTSNASARVFHHSDFTEATADDARSLAAVRQ
jgi:ABC-type transport system substrate-binding protein